MTLAELKRICEAATRGLFTAREVFPKTFTPDRVLKLLAVVEAANKLPDVIQSQFENGVRRLNEHAADEFTKKYSDISQWMSDVSEAIAALEE